MSSLVVCAWKNLPATNLGSNELQSVPFQAHAQQRNNSARKSTLQI